LTRKIEEEKNELKNNNSQLMNKTERLEKQI